MARYTLAYSSFVSRLDEINVLLRLASEKERLDPVALRREINALCRGAVVLLCSHLEAYVKEIGELALDTMHTKRVPRENVGMRFYYHISKNILDEIRDTSDPEKIAIKVFDFLQTDLSYWSQSGPLPQPIPTDQFNKGFSNPKYRKVRTYFNRFGCFDYHSELSRKLAGHFQPTITMVDHLVDIRNKIAHGDTTAIKTPTEVQDMVRIVREFCVATDSVFATWWRVNFCSIR